MNHQSRGHSLPRWRIALDTIGTLAVIAACATVIWTQLADRHRPSAAASRRVRREQVKPPAEPIDINDAALRGSRTARLVIVQFSEFRCPYCGQFARETLPAIEKEYLETGRASMAFRHLPLENIHRFALKAAESAECAGRQGKFWEMHDRLFRSQTHLSEPELRSMASDLGLNEKEFNGCLSGATLDKVRADAASAEALGITGTPTFIIGRLEPNGRVRAAKVLSGASSFKDFQTVLNSL